MIETPLIGALRRSSLHTLLLVTQRALLRSGFGDVQILDRRQTRQKSRFGGHEMLCQTAIGTYPARIIVKVINDAVRVRMMDELAGAVIRTGSDFGILVTPHHITKNAANQQAHYKNTRIEVVDGKELASLLEKHQIGIRGRGDVDYAFFGGLEDYSSRLLAFIANNKR